MVEQSESQTEEVAVPIATRIAGSLGRSSWIRRMFDEGRRLRQAWGASNVFDFSLGSPNLEPPEQFRNALARLVGENAPGMHRYMPNAGLTSARNAYARTLSKEAGLRIPGSHVLLTVGAAGGLNVALRALLNPGDEVLLLAPYFAEYVFYIEHAAARPVVVSTDPATFLPDPARIADALTPRTRVVLLNSPNNPSGRNYPRALLEEIAAVVAGRPIYLLMDEPYKNVLFTGHHESLLGVHPNAIAVGSHSKDLGLAGERIGYLAVSPRAPGAAELLNAAIFCQRTLGFVNAPALMQRATALCQDACVDLSPYRRNLALLGDLFRELGLELTEPEGGLFLFPRAPGGDDLALCTHLKKSGVLVVPGRAFGMPGYFRVSLAVDAEMIERSRPVWRRALASWPDGPS